MIPLEAWFIHGTLTVFQWLCFHGAPWCVHEIAINLTTMRKRPTMVPAEILQNTVAVAKNSRWWALYLSSTVCGGRWWTVVLFLLPYRHQLDSAVTTQAPIPWGSNRYFVAVIYDPYHNFWKKNQPNKKLLLLSIHQLIRIPCRRCPPNQRINRDQSCCRWGRRNRDVVFSTRGSLAGVCRP